jgi:hypothetical protein
LLNRPTSVRPTGAAHNLPGVSESSSDVPPDQRFAGLTYDAFRERASDPSLSSHERSGFPDSYREGAEEAILADVEAKLLSAFSFLLG